MALSETDLTIATSDGTVRVPLDEVHRAKRVPPTRRPTAADVVAAEIAANEAWPAPVQETQGGWLLRAAGGWTGRANSALPIGDPDRPLPAAIDAVEVWYRAHGLPPRMNVPLPLAAPVNAELDLRGWTTNPLTLFQTAQVAAILESAPDRHDLPAVRVRDRMTDEWLAVAAARKGTPPAVARHVLTAVPEIAFLEVYGEDGAPIGVTRATVTGGGEWLGVALVDVVPEHRRRGLGSHLVRAAARWGQEIGARRAFLQVEEHNAAAVALYNRLGFTTHHTYLTRTAPS
ncbi:ribosomal protein S18 acetylase RimI-like enzyme [Catenuloplanes atrovinosus]|uniref:Ribosomal protein S18 acetylase RimI-like enzyme n=1 Tax=Catenuloplanes atrovinosus TaxID=137266 RepID=A0AAE4CFA3_9ACTN|nr:ribosomal protein S18 acetylase RimI-like enzyme [Catenuloplanes atrovinosus]